MKYSKTVTTYSNGPVVVPRPNQNEVWLYLLVGEWSNLINQNGSKYGFTVQIKRIMATYMKLLGSSAFGALKGALHVSPISTCFKLRSAK